MIPRARRRQTIDRNALHENAFAARDISHRRAESKDEEVYQLVSYVVRDRQTPSLALGGCYTYKCKCSSYNNVVNEVQPPPISRLPPGFGSGGTLMVIGRSVPHRLASQAVRQRKRIGREG